MAGVARLAKLGRGSRLTCGETWSARLYRNPQGPNLWRENAYGSASPHPLQAPGCTTPMVAPDSQPWTMNLALNRKRSRLALDDDDEDEQRLPEPSPALSTFSDTLKRTRTQNELEELDIVRPEDAWNVDVAGILASYTLPAPPGSSLQAHNNAGNYVQNNSILVLCVQGNVRLHYDLLWYVVLRAISVALTVVSSMLPDLYAMSPSLQALVLCRDPSTHIPTTTAEISLPLVQAVGPNYNHFVRLGLLHPLGGGDFPLDALVVVDTRGRRRLVLPFGWGAGRHAGTPAGRIVQIRLTELLRKCIGTLVQE